ncbi:LOW QUALITY PROTEIN: NB-ARC domain-containing protein/LRR_4 domain-containing protein/LRR_7 domain-containing protein, partial [Cephalotus follicularis]
LEVLFDRLASRELLNFARREGLEKKLDKLKKTLLTIEAVLGDAEDKQLTDRGVKLWLDDLRDLAYDAEDILDEFATDALGRRLKTDRQRASSSKLRSLLLPSSVSSWSPSAVKLNVSMGSKIKDVTARLEEISNRKTQLGLQNIGGGTSSGSTLGWQRPPTTCLPTEPEVYGRDDDKKKVIDLLLRDEAGGANFRVVSIVGMGGLGKTTLARLVYNDEAVQGFDSKAWVCVSDDFDVIRLTKAILGAVTSQNHDDLKDLNQVQLKLRDALTSKKLLLILDNVWNTKHGLWEALKSPFLAGAPGSRIIVTTRDAKVAQLMGPIEYYKLKPLSNDDFWFVFVKHAFEDRDIAANSNLETIRDKIVAKCRGLPLAARTLGGLLRCKPMDDWEGILNSKIWNLESDILPVLRLSYFHLPSHLKRCFAYCAIFPKDYEFKEEDLVPLWMAEGLIWQNEGNKQMEELGGEYFRELLSRFIFQASSSHGGSFVMHDLVNDLAQSVAREICFHLEDDLRTTNPPKICSRARHSSYSRGGYDGITKFEAFEKVKSLRTFLPLPINRYKYYRSCLTFDIFNLLPKLPKLRVLSFSGYTNITELPNSIGGLKHLRYFNLSKTQVRSLPETTSSLYNLQSLLLRGCNRFQKFPTKMGNWINLRHLDITGVNSLTEMPVEIKELKSLRTLSDFVLGKNNGSCINELMNFKFLRDQLCISNLENVTDAQDAREANLNEKKDLDAVVLKWSSVFDDSRKAEIEKDVLRMLRPHQNLKKLSIFFYAGNGFPSWLGDPSFSSIKFLQLKNCRNCTCLPPLGQLSSLKELVIYDMIGVKSIGTEFYGNGCLKPFLSLETLLFYYMEAWDWNACQVIENVELFPCLRKLSILRCPQLSGDLPDHLPSLEELVIDRCERLVVSISSLPKLCSLEIVGCEEVTHRGTVDLNSLNSLVVSKISKLTCQTEGSVGGLKALEKLTIGGGCEWFTWTWLPYTLHSLKLWGIERLERLPEAFYSLTSLRELNIERCPILIFVCKTMSLSALYELKIRDCENLQSLIDDEGEDINMTTSVLVYLRISSCRSLRRLSSRGVLPATLKEVQIYYCPVLESISETFHNNTCLETVYIHNCKNLKSLPEGLHNLNLLREFTLGDCESVLSIPQGGLPTANLRRLQISGCQSLEALPNGMHNLTSLEELWISDCPGIISFPEQGFPTNLTSLKVWGVVNMVKPLLDWGLHRLNSLKELSVSGDCCPDIVSFEQGEKGMVLPTSLTILTIQGFSNLKHLYSSNGSWNLTSLERLSIYDCPKLTSFPKDGLPPSLESLEILNCPLLKQRCERDKGHDWPKIHHIPRVEIDRKSIYEP